MDQRHARVHGLEAPLGPATCTAALSSPGYQPPRAGTWMKPRQAAQEWFSREAASFQCIFSRCQQPLWMPAGGFPHTGIHTFSSPRLGSGHWVLTPSGPLATLLPS